MKKKTKALMLVLCAVLLVTASVLGTMAYLTSRDEVVNTFTVGKVAITLDEAKVDPDGTAVTPAERVKQNAYHLLPGHGYTKDPTVHVQANSEDSFIFVKVENGIAKYEGSPTIAAQIGGNPLLASQTFITRLIPRAQRSQISLCSKASQLLTMRMLQIAGTTFLLKQRLPSLPMRCRKTALLLKKRRGTQRLAQRLAFKAYC